MGTCCRLPHPHGRFLRSFPEEISLPGEVPRPEGQQPISVPHSGVTTPAAHNHPCISLKNGESMQQHSRQTQRFDAVHCSVKISITSENRFKDHMCLLASSIPPLLSYGALVQCGNMEDACNAWLKRAMLESIINKQSGQCFVIRSTWRPSSHACTLDKSLLAMFCNRSWRPNRANGHIHQAGNSNTDNAPV